MLSLILAALLAAHPAPASPSTHTPVIQSEKNIGDVAQDRENFCVGVVTDKIKPEEVVKDLELDSPEKRKEFGVECIMYLDGIQAGQQMNEKQANQP
jgi:hypothetical protein